MPATTVDTCERLLPGDPAPWFIARSTSNERYHFHTVAGRCVVLCFLGSAGQPYSKAVADHFHRQRALFDDSYASFFGVSVDPTDEAQARLRQAIPGFRYFWDFDHGISRRYGVERDNRYAACTVVIDARLRVLAVLPFDRIVLPEQHVATVMRVIAAEASFVGAMQDGISAPILVVPRVFEPGFCRELVQYFDQGDPQQSGFMREHQGKTVQAFDDDFKRRRDCSVLEESMRLACRSRLSNRLKPEVFKAFQFVATYAERYIVACYSSAERGFFKPHRDNTTKGTAHRRFAVTINLNTGEYDGGLLRFLEYGDRTFEAPLGGAIVFSCSLLHEATPVTAGRRYAFLPFLYDEAAARLRQTNMPFVATNDALESRQGGA